MFLLEYCHLQTQQYLCTRWHKAFINRSRFHSFSVPLFQPVLFCLWQRHCNGTWNSDVWCNSFPRQSQPAKLHPSWKDHPHPVTLKWWLGSGEQTRPHTIFSTESHQGSVEKCINRPVCMRDGKCSESRCSMAKSIHFQLSHALQWSQILFKRLFF